MGSPEEEHRRTVRRQFAQAAEAFAERSAGRFDDLSPVEFSRVQPGQSVIEVGGGTGNFISMFGEVAGFTGIFDLTFEMLEVARSRFPEVALVVADGGRLPVRARSIDLVATAQALHHMWEPVDVLKELRRIVAPGGRVLIVDSVATERKEEADAMNELDTLRDPGHAAFRSPSTMKAIVQAAGLEIVDEHLSAEEQTLSNWMWPGEFEAGTFEKVKHFIEAHGHETGMKFERRDDDWAFERRRLMLLCERA